MKFYFSGSEAIRPGPLRDWVIHNCPWRLQSCHSNYIKTAEAWLQRSIDLNVSGKVDIMLDSGAFTAWSLGHPMSLDTLLPVYERLQQTYAPHFKSIVFINLDVIPGTRETPPTEKEIKQSLIDSDKNFDILKQRLSPDNDWVLPVFHQGEQFKRLWECCDQSGYVCISPRQTVSENDRIAFVRRVRARLNKHRPDIKTHGLATTGSAIIRANEWHTVDSASWVITGGLGNVLIPDSSIIYTGQLDMFPTSVSVESPGKQKQDAHITTRSPYDQQRIQFLIDWINYEMQIGSPPLTKEEGLFTLENLSMSHEHRKAFNLIATQKWNARVLPDNNQDPLHLFDGDEDV